MKKNRKWLRVAALVLAVACLVSAVFAATGDVTGDNKVNVWDLQWAVNNNKTAAEQKEILKSILGGEDELNPVSENTYHIYTALGLYNMAKIVGAGKDSGVTFKLMNDIDMQGVDWSGTLTLNGVLEGNDHVISNFNIVDDAWVTTSTCSQGFFAKIGRSGAVQNLKLENVTLKIAEDSEATFAGLLAGVVTGKIVDCTTVGFVVDPRTELPGNCYIGTLAGRIDNVPDNPVEGISITDESILMTAETAEVTAISGKSQKVLCKMGMDFAELAEGSAVRELGIAGDAPDYTNFSSYNWQEISGSCTVTGGTGKVYNLEDPILTARRQATVDKMYEITTVEWTPSQNMTIYYYKTGTGDTAGQLNYYSKTWKAGKVYRGMPYNHGSGSLERFYAWMEEGTTTDYVTKTTLPTTSYYYTYSDIRTALSNYTDTTLQTPLTYTDSNTGTTYDLLPGFTVSDQALTVGETVLSTDHAGFSRYVGNDCSQAIQWAWREVVSNDVANGGTLISGVTQMTPTEEYQSRFGVVPVDGLVPADYSLTAWNALYEEEGATGFMEAYAKASRGDALICDQTAGGHSRMIAYDPICIYSFDADQETYVIDPQNSYIITHEQGSNSSGVDENGVAWSSTCYANCVYTFAALTDDEDHANNSAEHACGKCAHYLPTSIAAFHDVNSKAVTSTVTYTNGVVKSNFYILSTTVDGNEVFTAIGQHNGVNNTKSYKSETIVGPGYREAQLTVDVAATHGTLTGKTITVRLSNGDIYTVNGDTGAVTKN